MSNFFSGIGAVIATYIGTGISAYAAYKAWRAKSKVEEFRDELKIRLQDKELTKLIELGKKAEDSSNKFSSRKSTTSVGQNKENANEQIKDFLSGINENKHLIKGTSINNIYKKAKENLKNENYDELFFNISDIISILKKHTDTNITRE
ncbi:MAG: hypothetical protein K5829_07590 [Treponema sp.]|nr:hypothetical protein [Treponema sp.]